MASDAGFATVVYSATETGTSHAVADTLATAATYYWRVTASNGCGIGGASTDYSFTTLSTTFFCGANIGFEGGLPSDWSAVDNAGNGVIWTDVAGCGEAGNWTGGAGEAACAVSNANQSPDYDTELRSPVFDLSNASSAQLAYRINYQNFANRDHLQLDISTNGGSFWTTLLDWSQDHGGMRALPGESVEVDLASYLGESNLMLRWHYHDSVGSDRDYGWYAQVDDVILSCVEGQAIAISPSSLSSAQAPGQQVVENLQISNNGTAGLIWSLNESPSTVSEPAADPGQVEDISGYTLRASEGRSPIPAETSRAILAAELLHDQGDNLSVNGRVSQDLELSYQAFDSQGADNFTVPAGEVWSIEEVQAIGSYSSGGGPSADARIIFYVDDSGLPGDESYRATVSGVDGDADGTLVLTLADPAVLPAGSWWLSIEAVMDYDPDLFWYWRGRTVQAGEDSAWRNPNDGFATGYRTWTDAAGSGQTYPDFAFSLTGERVSCSAGDIPWISAITPSSGTTSAGGSSSVDVTFDSTGYALGVYTATLCVSSDDPAQPLLTVPLTMSVRSEYRSIAPGGDWSDPNTWVSAGGAPTTSDVVTVTAGSTVTVTGIGTSLDLVIEYGGVLAIPEGASLSVENAMSNQGTLQQMVDALPDGSTTRFLHIQDQTGTNDRYQGVDIRPTAGAMGPVTVAIRGGIECTTADEPGDTVNRCFDIEASGTADVTYYYLTSESDGLTPSSLAAWHWDDPGWSMAGTVDSYGSEGGSHWVTMSGVNTYSPFVLGDGGGSPTAVTMRTTMAEEKRGEAPAALLLVLLAASALGTLVLRRRSAHQV